MVLCLIKQSLQSVLWTLLGLYKLRQGTYKKIAFNGIFWEHVTWIDIFVPHIPIIRLFAKQNTMLGVFSW